jgi:hypothetical protein
MCNRQIKASFVFGRLAIQLNHKGTVDFLDVDPTICTASTELAISTSLRAAASGAA